MAPLAPRDVVLVDWLARALRARQRERGDVIELGCGDGELTSALARALPDASLLGLDLAGNRIERARRSAVQLPRARFEVLDLDAGLETLSTASADLMIAMDVLEHVFDVFGFVHHVARIVRPGGLVLLRVPNLAYIKHRVALLRGALPITSSWFGPAGDLTAWRTQWGWDGGHLHQFTQPTLRALLDDAGMTALVWRDPGARFEPIRRALPALLTGNLCVLAERNA